MSRRKSTPKKVTEEISTYIEDYEENEEAKRAYENEADISENIADGSLFNDHDNSKFDGATYKPVTKDVDVTPTCHYGDQTPDTINLAQQSLEQSLVKEEGEKRSEDVGEGVAMEQRSSLGIAKFKMFGKDVDDPSSINVPSAKLEDEGGSRAASRVTSSPVQNNTGSSLGNVHVCPYCEKVFPYKCHLQTHIRTHTGEKPFSCEHCGKHYANRSKLKRHMRSHTGERPYKCSHCNKCFSRSDNLTTHIVRTHQGLRVYPCELCTMSFTTQSHLQRHEKTHTDFRPYCCHLCEKKFSRQDNLETHIARIHGSGGNSGPERLPSEIESSWNESSILENEAQDLSTIKQEPVDATPTPMERCSASQSTSKRKRGKPRKIQDNRLIIDVDEESDSSDWEATDNLEKLSPTSQKLADTTAIKMEPSESSLFKKMPDYGQVAVGSVGEAMDLHNDSPLNLQLGNKFKDIQDQNIDPGIGRTGYRSLIPDALKKPLERQSHQLLSPRFPGSVLVPPSTLSGGSGGISMSGMSGSPALARRKRGRPPMEEYSLESGSSSRMNAGRHGDMLRYEILDEDGLNSTRVEVETMEMRAAVDVHICKYCGQPFGSQHQLSEHLKTHSENVHKCPICLEELCTQIELQEHMKLHTTLPFLTPAVYQMLVQRAHSQKGSPDVSSLRQDAEMSQQKHKCGVGSASFKSLDAMTQPTAEHRTEAAPPYKCHICNLVFASPDELHSHKLLQHQGSDLSCKHCPASFQRRVDLQEHIQKKHRLHNCDFCGKKFGMLNKLQRHLRRHTGERPYKCDHCGKCFSRSDNLQTHVMRMHGIVNEPVRCDMCDKKFNSTESLAEHYRIHTGEKPFPCKICEKSFMWISGLKKHMQTHCGDMPFGCKCCSERFETNDDLSHHMLSRHVRAGDANAKYDLFGSVEHEGDDSSDESFDSSVTTERNRTPSVMGSIKPGDLDEPMDLSFDGGTHPAEGQHAFRGDDRSKLGHNRIEDHLCNFCSAHCDSLPDLVLHFDLEHKDRSITALWRGVLEAAKKSDSFNNLMEVRARRAIDFTPESSNGAREDLKLVIGKDLGNWTIQRKIGEGRDFGPDRSLLRQQLEILKHESITNTADTDSREKKLLTVKLDRQEAAEVNRSPESTKSVEDPADLHCSLCNYDFKTSGLLHEHMETHILRTSFKMHDCQYTCRHCLRPFNDYMKFKVHLKWHSRWKQACDICGCKFDSRSKMERHMRVHTGERPYECCFCQKRFTRTENLKMHVMRLHDVMEPLICKFCGQMYKERDEFLSHCASEHLEDTAILDSSDGGERDSSGPTIIKEVGLDMKVEDSVSTEVERSKDFECRFCKSVFPCATSLTEHMVQHTSIDSSELKKAIELAISKEDCKETMLGIDDSVKPKENGKMSPGGADDDSQFCEDGKHCVLDEDGSAQQGQGQSIPEGNTENPSEANNCTEEAGLNLTDQKPADSPVDAGKADLTPDLWSNVNKNHKFDNLAMKGANNVKRNADVSDMYMSSPSTGKDDEAELEESEDGGEGDVPYLDSVDTETNLGPAKLRNNPRPYQCTYCDKRFTTKSHLVIHIRTHTGEKPYRCMYCDMCFRTSSKLGRHLKTHTGETPHKCPHCDRQFGRKDNLKAHLNRAHSSVGVGDSEPRCEKCGKVFGSEYALKQHMRSHSTKKHHCTVCNETFTWRCHLLKHFRNQHPEMLEVQ